ncbi:hypothetical protein SAMN04488061_3247 [Filomicrobium insigne]|uniref:Uncharacterized protein n=1 Tax=Filomicrobium insigne TaxID=418854 RepID=A0A1H0TBJ0_9HYPH|nr:hypothetical protein [Filomicrobium insigne]SDP51369.1 hypothetical protein SAMN04488061_3247 [Filomicrobium insigne]
MLDDTASRQLADRLTPSRLPHRVRLVLMSAGVVMAVTLVLAAGNPDQKRIVADVNNRIVAQQVSQPVVSRPDKSATAYGRAIAAMRGTIDLASAQTATQ